MNTFLIPFVIIVAVGGFIYVVFYISKKRFAEMEKQNMPFYQGIEQYAQQENLETEKIPLYTQAGRQQLYGLLPRNLPLTQKNWPTIPLYTDEVMNTKRRFLNAYVLTNTQSSSQQKVLVLPIYVRKDGGMFGVAMVTFPTPKTAHWVSIEPEEWLLRRSDVQLESREINDAYSLKASNRTLLTEVLDPVFMSRLQNIPSSVISVWVQSPLSYVAQKGILTQTFISNLREMSGEFQLRFNRAYPTYPEPKA